MSSTHPELGTGSVGRSGRSRRPTGKALFLAVLLVILVGYTWLGFQMEWVTPAGRIGAGFFPRVVGSLGILITVVTLVQALRSGRGNDEGAGLEEDVGASPEDEVGNADLGRHPWALVITVAAGVVLVATLTSLGAIVASALFLFGMLWFLNRSQLVTNVLLSVLLPLGLYLLFQTFLNAGLPSGILPRF